MNDKSEYWFGIAEDDIDTARGLLKIEKYLYVGFMCHQTIEKAFKGVIARNCAEDEIPPKIHNLLRLAERAGLFSELSEEQKEFFRELNPLNIEARYPEYKNRMAETLTSDKCEEIIRETGELLCWIKEQ